MSVLTSAPFFMAGNWEFHRPIASSSLSSPPRPYSSPLKPHGTNGVPQRNAFSSPPAPPASKFASRPTKPNPIIKKREEGQDARRKLFLKNVRDRGDDKAWERRAIEGHVSLLGAASMTDTDQLQALRTFHMEQKEFYRLKEREAENMMLGSDIDDSTTLGLENTSSHNPDEVMEEVINQHEMELEALITSFETPQTNLHRPESPTFSEDEFDELLMDLDWPEEKGQPQGLAREM
jgi:hypothetical protein